MQKPKKKSSSDSQLTHRQATYNKDTFGEHEPRGSCGESADGREGGRNRNAEGVQIQTVRTGKTDSVQGRTDGRGIWSMFICTGERLGVLCEGYR